MSAGHLIRAQFGAVLSKLSTTQRLQKIISSNWADNTGRGWGRGFKRYIGIVDHTQNFDQEPDVKRNFNRLTIYGGFDYRFI
jgi:hypothetical protein